jgi:hypothetical protein
LRTSESGKESVTKKKKKTELPEGSASVLEFKEVWDEDSGPRDDQDAKHYLLSTANLTLGLG